MRFFILIFVLFFTNSIFSQFPVIETGISYSNYNYKNSFGLSNPNIKPSIGSYFNFTIDTVRILRKPFDWGIKFTQYNSTGGNKIQSYDWNTIYTGVFLGKDFFTILKKLKFGGRVGISTIIFGKQQIAGNKLNLNKSAEFNGIWNQFGLHIKLKPIEFKTWEVNFNYSIENSHKLGNQGDEKLSFFSNFFGMSISPKKNKEKVINTKVSDFTEDDKSPHDQMIEEIENIESNKEDNSTIVENYPISNSKINASVFFDLNSSEVSNSFFPEIQLIVDFLKQNPQFNIELYGYSDKQTGNMILNSELSRKRVKSVIEILLELGIEKERVLREYYNVTDEFGKTFENLNRRVNIITVIE